MYYEIFPRGVIKRHKNTAIKRRKCQPLRDELFIGEISVKSALPTSKKKKKKGKRKKKTATIFMCENIDKAALSSSRQVARGKTKKKSTHTYVRFPVRRRDRLSATDDGILRK